MAKLYGAAAELYRAPKVGACPFNVGDKVEKVGETWEILSIHKIMRPYGMKDQDTYAVGYTYGLKKIKAKS